MTAALLTVAAADELLPAEQIFASSFSEKLDGYAAALIDETPVTTDVSQL